MRLQLREQQAAAGDIVLLYGDESEALTHPYLARAWAKSGADLRVPAPGQAKKVAILGSLNHVTHELIVHTSPTKRSSDFVAHLAQIDALYGPMPGRAGKPVVLVEDNGPIHVSKLSRAALAARAHWLTVEWLPKYAPELNDIEVVWHDLKAYQLAHKTFTDVVELNDAIHTAVSDLNRERMTVPLANPRDLCLEGHKIPWVSCRHTYGRYRHLSAQCGACICPGARLQTYWRMSVPVGLRLNFHAIRLKDGLRRVIA